MRQWVLGLSASGVLGIAVAVAWSAEAGPLRASTVAVETTIVVPVEACCNAAPYEDAGGALSRRDVVRRTVVAPRGRRSNEPYHLDELRIALDPSHPAHSLPPSVPQGTRILDVGCGAGQTILAAYPNHSAVGLDLDIDALHLGRRLSPAADFVCGRAEELPYPTAQFDLVVARVSLAYTDIGQSVAEIRRVLRPGGTVWMSLHPFELCWELARDANWKGRVYLIYVLVNSILFHVIQRQFRLGSRMESFQTEHGMRRVLVRAGFHDVRVARGRDFVITARV
jgi:ubiquinone/menaquinone biosynthesis C-methylase UbiE